MKNLHDLIKNMGRKPKDYIINKKSLQFRLKIRKEKPKIYGKMKNLVRIRCYLIVNGR